LCKRDFGCCANSCDDDIRGDLASPREDNAVLFDVIDRNPGQNRYPSHLVTRCYDIGNLLRHAAHQNTGLGLEHRHDTAALAGAGREFKPDESAADDGNAAAGRECGAQRDRILE
jgi:hypothetical protein